MANERSINLSLTGDDLGKWFSPSRWWAVADFVRDRPLFLGGFAVRGARVGRGFKIAGCAAMHTRRAPARERNPVKILIVSVRAAYAGALSAYLVPNFGSVLSIAPDRFATTAASADVIVIDSVLVPHPFELIELAIKRANDVRIIVVVARPTDFKREEIRRSGAHAVLSDEDGLAAWEQVFVRLDSAVFQVGPSFATAPCILNVLTHRQRQVYGCVTRGLTDDETARALNITTATAETHRRDVQRKLDCHGHSDVVAHGLKFGIIDPSALRLGAPQRIATRSHTAVEAY